MPSLIMGQLMHTYLDIRILTGKTLILPGQESDSFLQNTFPGHQGITKCLL